MRDKIQMRILNFRSGPPSPTFLQVNIQPQVEDLTSNSSTFLLRIWVEDSVELFEIWYVNCYRYAWLHASYKLIPVSKETDPPPIFIILNNYVALRFKKKRLFNEEKKSEHWRDFFKSFLTKKFNVHVICFKLYSRLE